MRRRERVEISWDLRQTTMWQGFELRLPNAVDKRYDHGRVVGA